MISCCSVVCGQLLTSLFRWAKAYTWRLRSYDHPRIAKGHSPWDSLIYSLIFPGNLWSHDFAGKPVNQWISPISPVASRTFSRDGSFGPVTAFGVVPTWVKVPSLNPHDATDVPTQNLDPQSHVTSSQLLQRNTAMIRPRILGYGETSTKMDSPKPQAEHKLSPGHSKWSWGRSWMALDVAAKAAPCQESIPRNWNPMKYSNYVYQFQYYIIIYYIYKKIYNVYTQYTHVYASC
jgi:hypothetical protein